ncbi:MAG TPA: ABC transporter permease [Thermoplasmata archaeon]|nr:ABC transporter permease [Thermoplasmata archaeon]
MATETQSASKPLLRGRRPNPRIAQIRRTLYFLSRNTLAIVGLGILIFFIGVAIYGAAFDTASSTQLQTYCGTYTGVGGSSGGPIVGCDSVCTYPKGSPPPAPNCYVTDPFNPSLIGPTLDLAHLSGGPLPLGSLTLVPAGSQFFSIYQGFVKGAQWTLVISAGIVAAGAAIGLLLGSIAGYKGGLVDELIMRVTDIFLSIPALLLVLVILAVWASQVSTLWGRIGVLMGGFTVTWWPIYTRIVRGQVLVTREQKYVEASKASGAKTGRILGRHIIPNSMYPVFVQMSLDVGAIPLLIAAIIFLGFQIFPTPYFPEWGSMAANSVGLTTVSSLILYCQSTPTCIFPWWQVMIPGLIVFLFAISVNFVSDGLRDALDPRLRR